MASTSSRTGEITVMSGEDLRIGRKPVKNRTFASIKVDRQSFGCGAATEINEEGGSYPFWNQKLVLDLPVDARFMTVEVHCRNSSRNGIVGTAEVPVSDFLGRFKPENYLHLLSYRLRDNHGERNGIVNISVRVTVPESAPISQATVGVPVAKTASFGRNNGGVVMGIPLRSAYSYRSSRISR